MTESSFFLRTKSQSNKFHPNKNMQTRQIYNLYGHTCKSWSPHKTRFRGSMTFWNLKLIRPFNLQTKLFFYLSVNSQSQSKSSEMRVLTAIIQKILKTFSKPNLSWYKLSFQEVQKINIGSQKFSFLCKSTCEGINFETLSLKKNPEIKCFCLNNFLKTIL